MWMRKTWPQAWNSTDSMTLKKLVFRTNERSTGPPNMTYWVFSALTFQGKPPVSEQPMKHDGFLSSSSKTLNRGPPKPSSTASYPLRLTLIWNHYSFTCMVESRRDIWNKPGSEWSAKETVASFVRPEKTSTGSLERWCLVSFGNYKKKKKLRALRNQCVIVSVTIDLGLKTGTEI